jgi:glycosyltransferase involved in cell wall biosynthesis
MSRTRVTVSNLHQIDPPDGGARLRLLGLYGNLGDDIDVTYVGSYQNPDTIPRKIRIREHLKEIDIPLGNEYWEMHSMLSPYANDWCWDAVFPLYGYLSTKYLDAVMKHMKKSDVAVISSPWIFNHVYPSLRENQLVIYDSQNFEGLLNLKLYGEENDITRAIVREVVRSEYELCHRADHIITCLQDDSDKFIEYYGVKQEKLSVFGNGAFADKLLPCTDQRRREQLREKYGLVSPTIVFMGSAYNPNVEAARLLLDISKQMPDFQFVLLGGLKKVLSDIDFTFFRNVIAPGFVSDQEMNEYLWASDIAVNPITTGSGSNVKMYEFMSAALPIITTEVGSRGIDNVNNNTYEISAIENLEHTIRNLINNPERMKLLSKTARSELCSKYDWDKISERLGRYLLEKLKRKRKKIKGSMNG